MKWLVVLMLLIPGVAAYDEADAPTLRDDVLRVWHSPDVPEPGQQWTGGIELVPGHNVSEVRYQICKVPEACFVPPQLATPDGPDAWIFDTHEYRAGDQVIPWGINDDAWVQSSGDWRIGVQYILVLDNGTTQEFPAGVAYDDPRCRPEGELGYVGCSETHYFVFSMPGSDPDQGAPAPAIIAVLLALAALAVRRR